MRTVWLRRRRAASRWRRATKRRSTITLQQTYKKINHEPKGQARQQGGQRQLTMQTQTRPTARRVERPVSQRLSTQLCKRAEIAVNTRAQTHKQRSLAKHLTCTNRYAVHLGIGTPQIRHDRLQPPQPGNFQAEGRERGEAAHLYI